MAGFDVMRALRLVQNDERVDLHARGTCEAAADEIERQREEIVRLSFALNKAKETCRAIMRDCDEALLYHVRELDPAL